MNITMNKETLINDPSNALRKKTFAVGSGKGGVGKTTTAANLAIYFAKKNLKVALVDLDPLSDIATILDLEDPESIHFREEEITSGKDLRDFVKKVFTNLDLLFPAPQTDSGEASKQFERLYKHYSEELDSSYHQYSSCN